MAVSHCFNCTTKRVPKQTKFNHTVTYRHIKSNIMLYNDRRYPETHKQSYTVIHQDRIFVIGTHIETYRQTHMHYYSSNNETALQPHQPRITSRNCYRRISRGARFSYCYISMVQHMLGFRGITWVGGRLDFFKKYFYRGRGRCHFLRSIFIIHHFQRSPPRGYSDRIRPNPTESDQIRQSPIKSNRV